EVWQLRHCDRSARCAPSRAGPNTHTGARPRRAAPHITTASRTGSTTSGGMPAWKNSVPDHVRCFLCESEGTDTPATHRVLFASRYPRPICERHREEVAYARWQVHQLTAHDIQR